MKEQFKAHTKPFSYITSPLFDRHGIRHLFTRREGGVSTGVYQSLNFATGSGTPADSWDNVVQNHRIAASALGLDAKNICRTFQTHSLTVMQATSQNVGTGIVKPPFSVGVDGLVCVEKDILLSVRGADCVTVLFCDANKGVCGACHSGWRGTAGKIVLNVLGEMEKLGAAARDTLVAIGPSVQACCYKVGEDVRNAFLSADSAFAACFTERADGLYLNLQQAVAQSLMCAGVSDAHISDCGECTVCDSVNYYSHRRDGVMRGTMAAFITL